MNQLIKLTGDGYTIIATPEAEKLKKELLKASSAITKVNDKETEAKARTVLTDLASFRKQLEATRKAVKEPVIAMGKKIDALAEKFGSEILSRETEIKGLIGDYATKLAEEQERIEREAEAKREAARRAEEEAAAKRAAEEAAREKADNAKNVLAEAKAEKAAEAARLEAERLEREEEARRQEAQRLERQAKETRSKGTSMVWDVSVIDIHQLYKTHPNFVTLSERRRDLIDWAKLESELGRTPYIQGVEFRKKPLVRA